jgi:hypothetical protein
MSNPTFLASSNPSFFVSSNPALPSRDREGAVANHHV